MRILVLDVGTSSMRGTVMDDAGKSIQTIRRMYAPSFGADGYVEQNPEDWLTAAAQICRTAAEAFQIDALALTSQRSSVILADASGNALRPAIMWQDTRSAQICERLSYAGQDIRLRTGSSLNTVYSGSKIAWLSENKPKLVEKAAHIFVIPDYLIFHMTGECVLDDTYGSRSLLMDLRRREWDNGLLRLFGVPGEKLSRIVQPGTVVGTVSDAWAGLTGFLCGTPVVTCGGDQQCAALGQGVTELGEAELNLGTGAYLMTVIDRVPSHDTEEVNCNTFAIPGKYELESRALPCGSAVDWLLRGIFGDVRPEQIDILLRESPPAAGGVTVLPCFQAQSLTEGRTFEGAVFDGVTLSSTRADLLRALVEGTACEIHRYIRILERTAPVRSLTVSGGLSRNPELCQTFANVCGRVLRKCATEEATTCGAWVSAVMGLRCCSDWKQAAKLVGLSGRVFYPKKELAALYAALEDKSAEIRKKRSGS